MDRTAAETISLKLDDACETVVACRNRVAELVTMGMDAKRISVAVMELAEAEGTRDMYSRLKSAASYHHRTDGEFTEAHAMKAVATTLAHGAEDTWSGRGNDTARARFDGMRAAAGNVEFLF